MFNLGFASAVGIIVRILAVYLVNLAGLRLAGKCEIGQMTVFDLAASPRAPITASGCAASARWPATGGQRAPRMAWSPGVAPQA